MSAIQFRTLGTLDLRAADGRELHSLLAQPKRTALLAYLCIADPRGYHRRDTLLGLFWPDADQEHARTSLRKSVHLLRRALGEDSIVSRGDEEIEVDRSRVSCDVESFEELIRANRFPEALEVYRGDLLTGFFVEEAPEFERWLHSQRARLRSGAARAAYEAAGQLEKKGDYAGALRFAERSLDLSDTDERTLRKVIELHAHAGNRAAALASYDGFARNLAAEYQAEPSAETRLLVERVRSGAGEPERVVSQPNTDVDRPAITSASHPTGTDSRLGGKSGARSVKRVFAAAVLTILIMSAFVWGLGRSSNGRQVVRYTLAVDSDEVMSPGASYWTRLAISPDGKKLAYIGGPNWELLIRPRDSLRATTVPNTKGAESPFFSPDGQHVGFLGEQRVYIVDANGELITVCDTLNGVAGASWGKDGFIYVDGQYYERLLRVPAKRGGRPEWFTTMDSIGHVGKDGAYKLDSREIDHTWPDVLPNGKGVLFEIVSALDKAGETLSYAIGVAEIPSGKHRVLINDAVYARYAASGHLLYVNTKKALMVVPFDQNSMTITGEPRTLVEGMRLGRFGSADVAVSQTGTLVYATGGGAGRQELVWMTRDGKSVRVDPDWIGDFWSLSLSPDGKRLAIARRLDGPRTDIWVKQLDRGPSIRLTREQFDSDLPAWTPDGKSVTFLSQKDSTFGYWTARADGSTSPTLILRVPDTLTAYMPVWSPDGKWLLYSTDATAADSGNIVGFRPGLDTAPIGIVATNNREVSPAVSPDGRWLAYVSNESGKYEVYVAPFPNTHAARWAISTRGGSDPQWSSRDNELFYRDDSGNVVAVKGKTGSAFSVEGTAVLFSTPTVPRLGTAPPARLSMFRARRYAVAPDASRFLMIQSAEVGPEKLIVVDNWFEELKAKKN